MQLENTILWSIYYIYILIYRLKFSQYIINNTNFSELLDTNERRNFVKGTSIDIPPDEEEEELLQLQEILLDGIN